jgi:hypothetical protein
LQGVLERAEVVREEQVQRAARRSGGPHPAAEDRCAGALLGLGEQVEQDRQLRLVLELAGDDRQRVGVEDREQLVLAQAEQLLQVLRRRAQSSCFSEADGTPPRYRVLAPIRPPAGETPVNVGPVVAAAQDEA